MPVLHKRVDAAVGTANIDRAVGDRRRRKNGAYRHHLLDAVNHVIVEKIGKGGFVLGRAIGLGVSCAVLFVPFRFKAPSEFLSLEIDGQKFAFVRANVEAVAGDSGRRKHRPLLAFEREECRAGFGVQRVKQARVRGREINFAILHGGRTDDPGAIVIEGPELFSGGGIHGVELGIAATEIYHSAGDGSRSLDTNLIVDFRVFAGFKAPFLFSRGSIQRVEKTIPAADKQSPIRYGGRSVNHIASLEFPFKTTGSGIECVDVGVTAAEIDHAAGYYRRREIKVERVRHGLGRRLRAVQMCSGEAAFSSRLKLPSQFARSSVNRVEIAIEAAEIDEASRNGGRRRDSASSLELPLESAAGGVERVEKAVAAADIERAIRYNG